jgi:hypothetical protein
MVYIDFGVGNMPPRRTHMRPLSKSPRGKAKEIGRLPKRMPVEGEDPLEKYIHVIKFPVP